MGNYVIAGVGNYVIVNPSNLGNYVIADNHLHFEVIVGAKPIDPVPFMLNHGAPLNGKSIAASPRPETPAPPPQPRNPPPRPLGWKAVWGPLCPAPDPPAAPA